MSCFTTDFAYGQEWTYDLAEIGQYYGLHLDLMAHWQASLPIAIREAHYERVVADLEGQARALLEFCGLPWDDRVLAFHEAERPVFTASNYQVRQSLYGSSVERWRRYEKYLGPLRAHLPTDAKE